VVAGAAIGILLGMMGTRTEAIPQDLE
jgi:hypothetical protein